MAVVAEVSVVVHAVRQFEGDAAEVVEEVRHRHREGAGEVAEAVDDEERARGVAPDGVAHSVAAGTEGVPLRLAVEAGGRGVQLGDGDGELAH